jgi:excisionase family DNA binding protein
MIALVLAVLWLSSVDPGGAGRKLLPIPEAAHRLGIGRTKLYELIAAGVIPTVRIGTMSYGEGPPRAARRLVPVEAIDAYADSLARETA